MTTRVRRLAAIAALPAAAMIALAGCSQEISGTATTPGSSGNVDTDKYDRLLLECQVVPAQQIATIVGGVTAQTTFNGAICRWLVSGDVTADVTLTWFEWGTMEVEKRTSQRLGYTTDNVTIAGAAAFTQRDPKRPGVCGVTANSPSRGIISWWVEPRGAAPADPCQAPTKLMELMLRGGQ
ncbi:DUF3558 domain-containing protein [Gordonia jinhuaensis]|uniref:Lipoprotein LprC n=1 Tax=Gordonia jinhuaensis TaxID=1517702 RepID=A0A916T819_9ACTN|nr:DUF3558 domain-containing protein [Gordonia jinhuaensis]GGB33455.1 putative lipoprotein LprC precursor [Gordonia jinhuaensis]